MNCPSTFSVRLEGPYRTFWVLCSFTPLSCLLEIVATSAPVSNLNVTGVYPMEIEVCQESCVFPLTAPTNTVPK